MGFTNYGTKKTFDDSEFDELWKQHYPDSEYSCFSDKTAVDQLMYDILKDRDTCYYVPEGERDIDKVYGGLLETAEEKRDRFLDVIKEFDINPDLFEISDMKKDDLNESYFYCKTARALILEIVRYLLTNPITKNHTILELAEMMSSYGDFSTILSNLLASGITGFVFPHIMASYLLAITEDLIK